MDCKDEQPEKAPLPIRVTLSGIETLLSSSQKEKAPLSIVVTLVGIETLVVGFG